MPNKFVTAVKENRDGARKKLAIAAGITVAAVAAAVILTKIARDQQEILIVTPVDFESIDVSVPTE